METISYNDLKLSKRINQIPVSDMDGIKVDSYLDFEEKKNLIEITVQQADEGDIINPILLEMYFDLNVVRMYSNIVFSSDADDARIYDELDSNGLIKKIMETIPAEEITSLNFLLEDYLKEVRGYRKTLRSLMIEGLDALSNNADKITQFVNNVDPAKLEQLQSAIATTTP